jgi:hypothetical protein
VVWYAVLIDALGFSDPPYPVLSVCSVMCFLFWYWYAIVADLWYVAWLIHLMVWKLLTLLYVA